MGRPPSAKGREKTVTHDAGWSLRPAARNGPSAGVERVYHRPVRRAPQAAAIGLALVTASTSACATYHPRASRFISRDSDGIFRRDGQELKVGALGGGAEALVSGDSRAVEYARRCKHINDAGVAVYLVGLATMIASPFVAAAVPDRAQTPTVYGVLGLGAGITLAGMALMFKGQAALIDAVNVYNDAAAAADRSRAEPP
jgi:hypothetical protein